MNTQSPEQSQINQALDCPEFSEDAKSLLLKVLESNMEEMRAGTWKPKKYSGMFAHLKGDQLYDALYSTFIATFSRTEDDCSDDDFDQAFFEAATDYLSKQDEMIVQQPLYQRVLAKTKAKTKRQYWNPDLFFVAYIWNLYPERYLNAVKRKGGCPSGRLMDKVGKYINEAKQELQANGSMIAKMV